jgi:serine protease AprX
MIKMPVVSALRGVRGFILLPALCLLAALSIAEANPGRARLSRDLADRLATGQLEPVRVIVPGPAARAEAIARRHGAQVVKVLATGAVIEVPAGRLARLSEDADVRHLSGDVPVQRMMAVTPAAIGADQVWSGSLTGQAYTGRNVGVAVIDSGVGNHKAVRARVVASFDFTGAGGGADPYGHGTHVAGIVAGAPDGGYPGVAPGAHIVSLRVLDASGSGYTSDVIAAIDWAVQNRARYNLRVINLSLGHPVFESYRDDPLCQAVERAAKAGLVVVASAGNFGKTPDGTPIVGGIVSPGNSPFALTVGATNTRGTIQRADDVMATYSSRGPTAVDGLLKPDVVAPGNRVAAAAAVASYLTKTYPHRVVQGQGQQAYIELSGTSMATAVVSGAAALLLEARPALTPAAVKAALQATSSAVPGAGLVEAGAGQINVLAALALVTETVGQAMPVTFIGGEATTSGGITYGTTSLAEFSPYLQSSGLTWGSVLVWSNNAEAVDGQILVWGNYIQFWGQESPQSSSEAWANILVWGNILVWSNESVRSDILVWGNQSVDANILIWSNILVWGNRAVEGNILIWSNKTVDGNILVWSNQTVDGNILVWSNQTVDGHILVWSNKTVDGNVLVWSNQTVNGNILVWSNQAVNSNILVWGNHIEGD